MKKKNYDISVIRPEMRAGDLKLRGKKMPVQRLKSMKKGLQALHTLEMMAVNIYKFQITKKSSEHNLQLIAAMCNEMTHLQDFQVKLFEFGFRPSRTRLVYWIVGFILGFFSRLIGTKAILKTGIWVERKAVQHYEELLKNVEWDDETRKIIEKDQADEFGHINRWESFLNQIKK